MKNKLQIKLKAMGQSCLGITYTKVKTSPLVHKARNQGEMPFEFLLRQEWYA